MKYFIILAIFACVIDHGTAKLVKHEFNYTFHHSGGFESYNATNLHLMVENTKFVRDMPTVLFLVNTFQVEDTLEVVALKKAYVDARVNFILVDGSSILYNQLWVDEWASIIARSLIEVFSAGLDLETFSILGNGYGAQLAGYVAREVYKKSKKETKIKKIIGFNPMRGFAPEDNLALSDAEFVMTIHTDIVLGDDKITGHAAFYVNKGYDQPTCPKILFFWYDTICENRQAQVFWTEGIKSRSATVFPARRCNSYEDYNRRICDPDIPIGYMNPKASTDLKGKYYLNTFRVAPYAKGNEEP